jgi:hypothetical protein
MATNPFADPTFGADAAGANPFSDPNFGKPRSQSGRVISDLAKSFGQGVMQLPGQAAGLADIPFALLAGARPITAIANAAGEATGFKPGTWAKQVELSPEAQSGAQEVGRAWESPDTGALDVAKAYLTNPAYSANQVAQSLPGMIAGGAISRLAMGGGALARAVGPELAAPVAAGVGEGAVQAGQQMQQGEDLPDQRKNAIAALGSGAVDALIGVGAGRVANSLGFETAQTAMAGGKRATAPLRLGARLGLGAADEALLQELPQSYQEQIFQNYAEGKPLTEGALRQAVEGAIAGGVMGAGANVVGHAAPQAAAPVAEQPAPAAAPLLALPAPQVVDAEGNARMSGQPAPIMDEGPAGVIGRANVEVPQGQPTLALPPPTVTVDSEGNARAPGQLPEQPEPGPIETGAIGQGRNSEPVAPASPLALPAPTITVDTSGNVLTTDQREQQRAQAEQDRQRRIDLGLPAEAPLPSRAMGLDPAAGPLTAAAAHAVDTGVSQAVQGASQQSTGQVFPNRPAAARAARQNGGDVIRVDGGWGISAPTDLTPIAEQAVRQEKPNATETPAAAAAPESNAAPLAAAADAAQREAGGRPVEAAGGRGEQTAVVEGGQDERQGLGQGQGVPGAGAARGEQGADRAQSQVLPVAPVGQGTGPATAAASQALTTANTAVQPNDIANPDGTPFRNRIAAGAALKKAGPGHEIAPLATGGFVVRALPKEAAAAPAEAKALHVGITPGNAEPVTVKDGVVHIGKEPALDFNSGEPVKVKAGASDAEVKQALKDAGALSKRQKFFGGSEAQAEVDKKNAGKPKPDDGTVPMFSQEPDSKGANESIAVEPGKGLITGKFLSSVDGDRTPGGPWSTEAEARAAAEAWRARLQDSAARTTADRARKDAFAQKLRDGHQPTPAEVELLGLRARGSDLTYFIPHAAELFGISSRAVRPLIADLIRVGHTDMGAKRESVNPMKALSQMGAALKGDTPSLRQDATSGAPLRVSEIRKAIAPALDSLKVPFELHSSIGEAQDSSGLKGIPAGVKGMYFGGKLHLIAEGIKSPLEAEETLWHEVNHAGIDQMYGSSKNTKDYYNAMRGLAMQNANIREAAKEWLKNFGADDTKARIAAGMTRDAAELRTKLQAIEEALSELAGRNAKINGAARFIAAVQKFMRAVGLNRLADSLEKLTDAQALSMIYRAREAVMKEPQAERAPQLSPAFSKEAKTESIALLAAERQRLESSMDEVKAVAPEARLEDGKLIVNAENASKVRKVLGVPPVGPSFSREYTPAQEQAMRHTGMIAERQPLAERLKPLWQNAGKILSQGIVDQFRPVRDISEKAYSLLRLSKGAAGAFEVMLHGGRLRLSDGVYDFDETKRGGVIERLLTPLQGEHHDFLRWVAANRAESLSKQDREHLFTPEDIAALKTLAEGQLAAEYTLQHGPRAGQTTRERAEAYRDSLKTFNEFNKNALDMAEQSGLIDAAARPFWENEFYVPFYRVDEEGVRGVNVKSGVVRQQAFKALKGGSQQLNADLLENTLMNWAHLLDAAAKNRAAKATLEAMAETGNAIEADSDTASQMAKSIGKRGGTVWFMDEGRQRHFVVDDPYLLAAVNGLEFAGFNSPAMKALGAFKHYLTLGVTASPFFKIRNLIRDSVQAIGSGPLSYNVAGNLMQGWKATDPASEAYFRLMAGGGTIHFGTMLEGSEAKRVQALVEAGVDRAHILDSNDKVKAFYRSFVEPAITAYNELGNRGEAINRAALYQQLIAQGKSHAEASLMARDLMDFSMQGSWNTIRFLTQVVPFMNARLQGLYKLGRAAKEDPARFSMVLGATALGTLGLLGAYHDDDDWKKREDWDRNNFWWFKFGGTAFRIPKPFEIGAIATLAERSAEWAFVDEMTGKRFRDNVWSLLGDNLSMNPIPQLVKPMLDVYANTDSFTNRPIEPQGMENLKPEYRFNQNTSMTARAVSTGLNAVTDLVGANGPSPLQVDHLIQGYFSWLGAFVVGAGDAIARPATGQPNRPAPDYWKTATGGMVANLEDAPSRYVTQMYQQAKAIEQAYGTWRELVKEGKTEEAQAFREDNAAELARYRRMEAVKRIEGQLNLQAKRIAGGAGTPDEKRESIRVLRQRQDAAARSLQ